MKMKKRMPQWTAAVLGAAALAIGVAGSPAQAFSVDVNLHVANWYGWHSSWMSRCSSQPEGGRFARDAHYENWCRQNARYRSERPDAQWRADHPWDHGNNSDRQH